MNGLLNKDYFVDYTNDIYNDNSSGYTQRRINKINNFIPTEIRNKVITSNKIESNKNLIYKSIFPKNERVLGAVYRGTDYYSAYNHPIPESIDDFESRIKEYMIEHDYKYCFVATEIQEVIDELKEKFGEKLLYTSQRRYSINERRFLADVHFDRENDEYQKGVEYLVVLELLARCEEVIGKNNATIEASGLIRAGLNM